MRTLKTLLMATVFVAGTSIAARADINVVASIKPVHSLVAAVMNGVGEPGLIVEGAGSPHTFAMKPSQAAMLEKANIVFWIGHELEAFLEKPIETIASGARSVELVDSHDLIKLPLREGGAFEAHDHGDHDGHEDHGEKEHAHDDHGEKEHAHDDHGEKEHAHDDHGEKEHAHDDHGEKEHAHDDHGGKEHAHDDHGEKEHAHDEHGHDEHGHGEFNVHVWLDPANAKAMVHEIEEALVKADPENADKYEANAKDVMARLDTMTADITAELKPVGGKPFVVFHDAYHNFENRFGLAAAGSITVSPEVQPGAERVTKLRAKVRELGATCVFSEPQFEPKLVETVIEGTSAKSGVLDPLGASLEAGPALYFDLIRNLATNFKTCLSEAS